MQVYYYACYAVCLIYIIHIIETYYIRCTRFLFIWNVYYTRLKIFSIMEQCVFFLHPQNNKLWLSDMTLICDTFVVTMCKSIIIIKKSTAKKMWHFVNFKRIFLCLAKRIKFNKIGLVERYNYCAYCKACCGLE